jgi:hypothetical protein
MILIENLWDREAMPWQGDWYRKRVEANFGTATGAHFRLWMTDHALHGDNAAQEDPTRTVSYIGVLQQALRDLATWVETGVAPPDTTAYTVTDGQVIVPPSAAARRGIQPVVVLKANGGASAQVGVGKPVQFSAIVEAPPGTGKIVAADWDFDSAGRFPVSAPFAGKPKANVMLKAAYSFARPGTYFPALRVASERHGDRTTPYARVENLGRVRVVVK